jgi:FkbM family methyltransferase
MKTQVFIGAPHSELTALYDCDTIIYVVEPITENINFVCNSSNTANIKCIECAMADYIGKGKINLSLRWDSHSLYEMIEQWGNNWESVRPTGEVIEVDVITWDYFIGKYGIYEIDFCLVDAEGAEGSIIKGMNNCLPKAISVASYHSHVFKAVEDEQRLIRLLIDKGYTKIHIKRNDLEGDHIFCSL